MPTKYTKIANKDEIKPGMTNDQADILALAHIVKDLADSMQGLYGFCNSMFDIHWPCSEHYNNGRESLDFAEERLSEARIFDHYTREWLEKIEKESNGEGDRK